MFACFSKEFHPEGPNNPPYLWRILAFIAGLLAPQRASRKSFPRQVPRENEHGALFPCLVHSLSVSPVPFGLFANHSLVLLLLRM